MAHKARRKPSWKKKPSKYHDRNMTKLYAELALEIRKEIDREILERLSSYADKPHSWCW